MASIAGEQHDFFLDEMLGNEAGKQLGNLDMPKQLPDLDTMHLNFDLQMRQSQSKEHNGFGTPKFNEEDQVDSEDENDIGSKADFYARKRRQILARKELFAMENYRSE